MRTQWQYFKCDEYGEEYRRNMDDESENTHQNNKNREENLK